MESLSMDNRSRSTRPSPAKAVVAEVVEDMEVAVMAVDAVADMVEDVEVADTEEDAAETMEEADMVAEATEVDREAMAEAKVDTAVAVMVEAREVMEAGVINSSFSLNICTNKQKVFLSLSSSNFHI